jgi:hypothetical protein
MLGILGAAIAAVAVIWMVAIFPWLLLIPLLLLGLKLIAVWVDSDEAPEDEELTSP